MKSAGAHEAHEAPKRTKRDRAGAGLRRWAKKKPFGVPKSAEGQARVTRGTSPGDHRFLGTDDLSQSSSLESWWTESCSRGNERIFIASLRWARVGV